MWLPPKELDELQKAIVNAVSKGEITGNECACLIDLLATPLDVPCERTKGHIEIITIQLIDQFGPHFKDLGQKLAELSRQNLADTHFGI